MVVEAIALGREVDAERDDRQQDPDGDVESTVQLRVRPTVLAARPSGLPCATLRSTFHARAGAVSPVTGPVSGGDERGTGAPSRSTGMQGTLGAILIVLALGLALRLILAYLLPGSGFDADLGSFRFWADDLARNGFYGFYEREFFHDYTPGYLYVLWLVGTVGNALGGIGDLIKIPPILGDLAIGYLVWSMIRELGGRERLALLGAAVVVVNPVFWFDNVVWGQVDSVGVVFVLLALRSLWRDQPERAAIFTVIAALVKPQLGHPRAARRGRDDPAGAVADRRRKPARPRGRRTRRATASWTGCGPGRRVPATRCASSRPGWPAS